MRILIVNDDGIDAPGIRALAKAFAEEGHDVGVVAPDGQRSAASHSMTLFAPLRAQRRDVEGARCAYAISGTPVDCVKLALNQLYPEAEFVVSGINHGYNMGTDVLYSGTVGAAMEGALYGLPAMAVSLAPDREDLYDAAAQLALRVFDRLQSHPLPAEMVLNLNHPAVEKPLGIRAVPLKSIRYVDEYSMEENAQGEICFHPGGVMDGGTGHGEDDYSCLLQGYATMTVLHADWTAYEATRALQAICSNEK